MPWQSGSILSRSRAESYKWRRMIQLGDIQYSMEQLHLDVVSEMDRLASKVEIWVFSTVFELL